MPDGEPNKWSCNNSSIINKLRSFFRFKNKNSNFDQSELKHQPNPIENKIDYQQLKAEDVMIPRVDIAAVDSRSSLAEIAKIFLDSRHTRMPVYKQDLDHIIGFINIKDILPYLLDPEKNTEFSIDKVLRNLLIISPSMKIFDLLEQMRQTRTHIALVVDEFGGADGLITIEDLVEEIIGEIDDEYDQDIDAEYKKLSDNDFEVSGRLEISVLEEKLGMRLSNGDKFDTVGGLILSISGHVPEKGEVIMHEASGLKFEIIDSDPRRIKKVLISCN